MISFKNDYSEGAHPRILETLAATNLEQAEGYGLDRFCMEATGLLRQAMGRKDADVHFVPGGTQTNLIALSAFLRPHEAAVAAVAEATTEVLAALPPRRQPPTTEPPLRRLRQA